MSRGLSRLQLSILSLAENNMVRMRRPLTSEDRREYGKELEDEDHAMIWTHLFPYEIYDAIVKNGTNQESSRTEIIPARIGPWLWSRYCSFPRHFRRSGREKRFRSLYVSIPRALASLEKRGLATWARWGGINLTEKGLSVIRRTSCELANTYPGKIREWPHGEDRSLTRQ